MNSDVPEREQKIMDLAGQFQDYLHDQTGVNLVAPKSARAADLDGVFTQLDAALDQLSDLANVYGTNSMADIDPLVLPAAALTGEYLRQSVDAEWIEPTIDPDTTLIIAMQDGVAIDLTGAIRASLLSGKPNLSIMIDHLLHPDQASST